MIPRRTDLAHIMRDLIEHVESGKRFIPERKLARLRALVSDADWRNSVEAAGLCRIGRTSILSRRVGW